jgi:hypothetical protein
MRNRQHPSERLGIETLAREAKYRPSHLNPSYEFGHGRHSGMWTMAPDPYFGYKFGYKGTGHFAHKRRQINGLILVANQVLSQLSYRPND